GQELANCVHPGFWIVVRHHGFRHRVLVEDGLVLVNGFYGDDVVRSVLGFDQPSGIAGYYGDAAEHGFHDDEAEAFIPEGRHEKDAGAGEDIVDVAGVGEDADVGEALEGAAVVRGGAPAGHDSEIEIGEAGGGFQED